MLIGRHAVDMRDTDAYGIPELIAANAFLDSFVPVREEVFTSEFAHTVVAFDASGRSVHTFLSGSLSQNAIGRIQVTAAGVEFLTEGQFSIQPDGTLSGTIASVSVRGLIPYYTITGLSLPFSEAYEADEVIVFASQDWITGSPEDDYLIGYAGNDAIEGGWGNDTLDGGPGIDWLDGGEGDDTFIIDASDTVIDARGTDTIVADFSHALPSFIENLRLAGSGDYSGTGNDAPNVLWGNAGNNVLDGRGGTDTYYGGQGDDTYLLDSAAETVVEYANEGVDTVVIDWNYTLPENLENATLGGDARVNLSGNALANLLIGNSNRNFLFGSEGNDDLRGGGGNDALDGGTGADRLAGNAGDDFYRVDDSRDVVYEAPNEGVDRVEASVSFALPAHVEMLLLQGSAPIEGLGNELSNLIVGNSNANLLDGGSGADTLFGGEGDDVYVVDTAADRIMETYAPSPRSVSEPWPSAFDGSYHEAAASQDGRHIVFSIGSDYREDTASSSLVQVYLRDMETGLETRLSESANGTPGNQHSLRPSISADGNLVAFQTAATNVIGPTNFGMIVVRDVAMGTTVIASSTATGTPGNGDSYSPSLSQDGRYVAFTSRATDLVPGMSSSEGVYVKDLTTGSIVLVSSDAAGNPLALGFGTVGAAKISGDGSKVAFTTSMNGIAANDTNHTFDVFFKDLDTGALHWISEGIHGAAANGPSILGALSHDGRYVAFESRATNLSPQDTTANSDIYIRDTSSGALHVASAGALGPQPRDSVSPQLSADGRYVAFTSADVFVLEDTNQALDVYVRDTVSGTIERHSVKAEFSEANGNSELLAMASSGSTLVYATRAYDLLETPSQQSLLVATKNLHMDAGGWDTISTSVSLALPTYVEELRLQGEDHLTGDGNELDNVLQGNAGHNALRGGAGNDTLLGAAGYDTALYSGRRGDYDFIEHGDFVVVADRLPNRDGIDRLRDMEQASFEADGVYVVLTAADIFTPLEYIASHADLIAGFDANAQMGYEHFITTGRHDMRTASFDGLAYLASNPDLMAGFGNDRDAATAHYIQSGRHEGRSIAFNGLEYIASYADLIDGYGVNEDGGTHHYIAQGRSEGRTVTFRGLEYLASNPDLMAGFGDNFELATIHYISAGRLEGRSATFQALEYIASYADLIQGIGANINAGALHYINSGRFEGRTEHFDAAQYLANYADLAAGFGGSHELAAIHYIQSGFHEGRTDQAL